LLVPESEKREELEMAKRKGKESRGKYIGEGSL
jgi:hypothetical protein